MFTGLVQTLATVTGIQEEGAGVQLHIHDRGGRTPEIGASIAVNGVCLTVVAVENETIAFQVGPETLSKTNLGQLEAGHRVNLERSLRVGDPLGGHWVQGHVDGVCTIASREKQGEWELVWFECSRALTAQIVPKGSVAVDGVSLTVVDVERTRFSVALIPHTLEQTTLGFKQVGDLVNLEADIIGKYVAKHVAALSPDS